MSVGLGGEETFVRFSIHVNSLLCFELMDKELVRVRNA